MAEGECLEDMESNDVLGLGNFEGEVRLAGGCKWREVVDNAVVYYG